MSNLSLNNNREFQVFFITYGVWLVFVILNISLTFLGGGDNALNKAIRAGAILVLVIFELITAKDKLISIPALLMAGLVLLGGFFSAEMSLIEATIFVVCAARIPFDSIAKFSYRIIGITCIAIIVCALAGFIPNAEIGTARVIEGDVARPRYTLGFMMYSYGPRFLATFSMLYFWVNKEKSKWFIFIAIAVINIGLYYATDTRVGYYLVWLILTIAALCKLGIFRITRWPIVKHVLPFSFAIIAGLAILLTLVYDPSSPLMTYLDRLLSLRLQMGSQAIDEYGFSLLGQKFEAAGNKWIQGELIIPEKVMVVDSSYVHLLVSQGIATLVVIIVGFSLVLKRLCREHEDLPALMLVCVALVCFIDGQLWLLYFNPFLMLLATYVSPLPQTIKQRFRILRWQT